ncbi:MAG: GAF domain-containing protein [Proteobacteria bacterium]|nr:GAF domain-containing protein [Pseudomonadota bacterium]
MSVEMKKIAIIGANKEGLKLLPTLVADPRSNVCVIADSNSDAMLFKLSELGYKIPERLGIDVVKGLECLKEIDGLDIIIDATEDPDVEKFLEEPCFNDIEKLGPLSTRLLWGVRASTVTGLDGAITAGNQTALLGAFRDIVDAVRLSIDRKELLSVILKLATESTGAERGSIMLTHLEDATLRVEIAKGMDDEVVRKIRVPVGEGISGRVAQSGVPHLISGKADSDEYKRPMNRSDVKSAMCVPLIVKGEVIGVINVNSNESKHVFTDDDLQFLSSLAALAAEVIQRSNEYETLRVNAAKFKFWKDVDAIMSAREPIERRLNRVARKLSSIIPGLTCFIYIYDDDTGKLFLKASSIRDAKAMGMVSLRPGEGVEGAGFEAQHDLFLVERTEDSAVKRLYITLPMHAHGTRVGTFNAQVVAPHGISKHHEQFLLEIRELIALSVYKHKLTEGEKMRSRKMFAVDEAGLEMISIGNLKRLSTVAAITPAAIIGAEGSLLRLKLPGSTRFKTVATFGLDSKPVREYFLPIEKETVMEVLRKSGPVSREFSEEASIYIRSVLSYPLKVDGRVIGLLTLFNKSSEEYIFPCAFSADDLKILTRFCVYSVKALSRAFVPDGVEKAPLPVTSAQVEATAPTPEPAPATPQAAAPVAPEVAGVSGGETKVSPLTAFEARVEQELNRTRRLGKSMSVATLRIAGLKDASFADREEFETLILLMIRKSTRNFDVLTKLNDETYAMIFPNTNERVVRLLDAISGLIMSEERFTEPYLAGRLDVLYGYGTFPEDGDSFAELYSKATTRERLNLNRSIAPELNVVK